jgi:hypothetical protein
LHLGRGRFYAGKEKMFVLQWRSSPHANYSLLDLVTPNH